MGDQPLLIALVAVQFFVHALGWAMAARLTRRWHAAEGLFAVFWLLLSAGLMLYVPPWPSGSAPRNIGDLLIVGAIAGQHAGMALYFGKRPGHALYAVVLVGTTLAVLASMAQETGHGLRVAAVCVGVAVMQLATVRLLWREARPEAPLFAGVVCGGYGLLAIALLARAVQALSVGAGTKISIDAPGHSNVPFAIVVMFIGGLINLAQIRLVLGRVLQHLTTQALTDALTGAVNRRGLMQRIEALHRAAREGDPGYGVMMVDVDHFKAVNDQHGHHGGDQVLQRIAQALREGMRANDVVARWGGEEFCVLLPCISLDEARALAERAVQSIAASGKPRVTISVGVAEADAQREPVDAVIRRADAALYRAKQEGRNRVVIAGAAA